MATAGDQAQAVWHRWSVGHRRYPSYGGAPAMEQPGNWWHGFRSRLGRYGGAAPSAAAASASGGTPSLTTVSHGRSGRRRVAVGRHDQRCWWRRYYPDDRRPAWAAAPRQAAHRLRAMSSWGPPSGTASPEVDAIPAGTDVSSEDVGCGCRVGGGRSSSSPLGIFGALGLLALRSVRRRPETARRRPR